MALAAKQIDSAYLQTNTTQQRHERDKIDRQLVAATVVIGFFTLALVAATIGLICVGQNQAKKLGETIDQMKESEQRQSRAYVGTACDVEHSRWPGIDPSVEVLGAYITLSNSGLTPAHELRSEGTARVVTIGDTLSYEQDPTSTGDIVSTSTLHPRLDETTVVANTRIHRFDMCELVGSETQRLHVFGIVEYRDMFRDTPPHRTRYSYLIQFFTPTTNASDERRGRFEAIRTSDHNNAT